MGKSAIRWTDATWNPVTGCSHVSDGCKNCYAETLSLKRGWSKYPWTANHAADNIVLHPDRLRIPLSWKTPHKVFVNSMSDLFHPLIPDDFIRQVWDIMLATPQHTYQILTKRPERAATWPGPWAPHIWMGTSVEDERVKKRVGLLRQSGAAVRFLSCEPLIGPLDLTGELTHPDGTLAIHWVIVGGESGPGYRPMDHAWARALRDVCVPAGTAYFFKQSAAFRTEMGIGLLSEDGARWIWQQYPGDLAAATLELPAVKVTHRLAGPPAEPEAPQQLALL